MFSGETFPNAALYTCLDVSVLAHAHVVIIGHAHIVVGDFGHAHCDIILTYRLHLKKVTIAIILAQKSAHSV